MEERRRSGCRMRTSAGMATVNSNDSVRTEQRGKPTHTDTRAQDLCNVRPSFSPRLACSECSASGAERDGGVREECECRSEGRFGCCVGEGGEGWLVGGNRCAIRHLFEGV